MNYCRYVRVYIAHRDNQATDKNICILLRNIVLIKKEVNKWNYQIRKALKWHYMDPYIYRLIHFILLLICLIPSFIFFLLVFFFLFKSQEINSKRRHNHVILLCNFILITTELPITLVYSYQGYVQPQNDQFCSFWVAYNYGLFLMAFASIERYFLIFTKDLFLNGDMLFIIYQFLFVLFIH